MNNNNQNNANNNIDEETSTQKKVNQKNVNQKAVINRTEYSKFKTFTIELLGSVANNNDNNKKANSKALRTSKEKVKYRMVPYIW